ncbi:hypothetical protein Z042_14145 [Chania multitudinisentens RB-25]|uniref:Uncharacterized protein n=1 Tax=Chania multitudinisentens RB-25 TaxID=1441930 RepID=W0LGD4_9GAMM|nr:hypothetical protein [Chania multitudinisentens]AHG22806.1 hypothetical protein Z042_14145 [Chania multitudinisentens RB-25]
MTSIQHAIMALLHRFLPWSGLMARLIGALWQCIRLAYRVLLVGPAVMLALLLTGSLLIVQYTEPQGARRVLEARLVESILAIQAEPAGYLSGCQSRGPTARWPGDTPPSPLLLNPCEPESISVAQVVNVTIDSLISLWFSLVMLSVVLEVIARCIGFSISSKGVAGNRGYRSASGATGAIVEGRCKRIMKKAGDGDE